MSDFLPDVEAALEILKQGGLILYPTDTIWGIGCDATNEAAVQRIYALKQRPDSKSMIVLLAEERDVIQYVSQPDLQVFDYLQTATKPTTIIYEGAIGLAQNLLAADGSIAIRLVQDVFCRHLIKRLRKPLVSTSANISGMPAPQHFGEVAQDILSGVDYVVKYRQDDRTPTVPSAIIRWTNGRLQVIRE
jgi:L-threonylcarbamoyladenylate synthase